MNEALHPGWVIFEIAIFNVASCIIPLIGRGEGFLKNSLHKRKFGTIIFSLCLIFLVYAMWDGDWVHYQRWYNTYYKEFKDNTHIEAIYCWLRENMVIESYLLFRLIIWGGSIYIYRISLKRLNANYTLIWIVYAIISLIPLTPTRGTLGLSFLFLGYTYLIKPQIYSEKRSYFVGMVFMLVSLVLHKSLFVPFALAILSFIPFRKLEFLVTVFFFPIISAFVVNYSIEINEMLRLGQSVNVAGSTYLGVEGTETGIAMKTYYTLSFIPIAIITVICVRKVLFQRNITVDKTIARVFHWCYYFVFMYLIAIQIPFGSEYFAPRFLQFVYLPLCYLIYLLYKSRLLGSKTLYYVLLIGIVADNCRLFYSLFLQM